jgi:hypothetical protein
MKKLCCKMNTFLCLWSASISVVLSVEKELLLHLLQVCVDIRTILDLITKRKIPISDNILILVIQLEKHPFSGWAIMNPFRVHNLQLHLNWMS